MLQASLTYQRFHVNVFAGEGTEHANQDRWLVLPTSPTTLRVVVLDGVTPWRSAPTVGGDSAQYAAAQLLSSLNLPIPLNEAFLLANRELYNPQIIPPRRRAMTAAAAADLRPIGDLDGFSYASLVASDCEVWGSPETGERMHLVSGGDAWQEEAKKQRNREL